MSFKRGKKKTVHQNREHFLSTNRMKIDQLVGAELIHGNKIAVVGCAEIGRGSKSNNWIKGVDGLVTSEKGILLSTTHADCLPVVLYDPNQKVIGQAHCGWRGLHAGIIPELIKTILNHSHSDSEDLHAWIGPGICPMCYIVDNDVANKFPSKFVKCISGKLYLDLFNFAISDLINQGITTDNITLSGICTSCDASYSSFRRDGNGFNAMILVTGL